MRLNIRALFKFEIFQISRAFPDIIFLKIPVEVADGDGGELDGVLVAEVVAGQDGVGQEVAGHCDQPDDCDHRPHGKDQGPVEEPRAAARRPARVVQARDGGRPAEVGQSARHDPGQAHFAENIFLTFFLALILSPEIFSSCFPFFNFCSN